VVECIVKHINRECKVTLFETLLSQKDVLTNIMMDKFGNYVIQAIFMVSKQEFNKELYYDKLY